jgi:glycosyltransferase involved in cell wall biosynthesis
MNQVQMSNGADKSRTTPIVSICMPHLNSQPFTKERMETILRQTLDDWELIIVDSHSDDGSLELLEQYARDDERIRIVQAPRDGIYPNWNRALKLCRGEYVYIATSDDTMSLDCLEQMAKALSQNPDCGLCHCCLEIIDEHGRSVSPADSWDNYTSPRFFGELIHQYHVRRAPHDGLLHLGLFTIYTSFTQLLVRRRVYDELGLFRTDCGTYADFEWGMRVALRESVVHVPYKLATWRRHGGQATQFDRIIHTRARGEFRRLVHLALKSLDAGNRTLADALRKSPLNDFYLAAELDARRSLPDSAIVKLSRVLGFGVKHPLFSLRWLFHRVVRRERIPGDFKKAVHDEFARLGLTDLVHKL